MLICNPIEYHRTFGPLSVTVKATTTRVWRHQRGNQNPQWPKEKVQRNKQRSTKHTHKTKDRVTRTPLKSGVNSGAPELAVPAMLP
jgi:hypothetical protein